MNAKQKANELVDRYVEYVEAYSSQGQIENAKICALIAVEELIEITYAASRSEYEYWLDVKRYIKAIA
jgi:predicted HAD superfamily Cof-like phosphohydrolase